MSAATGRRGRRRGVGGYRGRGTLSAVCLLSTAPPTVVLGGPGHSRSGKGGGGSVRRCVWRSCRLVACVWLSSCPAFEHLAANAETAMAVVGGERAWSLRVQCGSNRVWVLGGGGVRARYFGGISAQSSSSACVLFGYVYGIQALGWVQVMRWP